MIEHLYFVVARQEPWIDEPGPRQLSLETLIRRPTRHSIELCDCVNRADANPELKTIARQRLEHSASAKLFVLCSTKP